MELDIDGNTRLICLLGNPVSHSLSPLMQNYALRKKQINAVYLAFKVDDNTLKNSIECLKALNFIGANITIPYKIKIIKYLDAIDDISRKIGAVNTIINRNNRLSGYNTDGLAALELIEENVPQVPETKILILGAGGVSRAICYYLAKKNAEIILVNRTPNRANELLIDLKKNFRSNLNCKVIQQSETKKIINEVGVIINATSVGMWPNIAFSPIEKNLLAKDKLIFDTVYNPLETQLIKDAKNVGCKIIEGYKMLVRQGVLSFKLWTNIDPPSLEMEKIVFNKLKQLEGKLND